MNTEIKINGSKVIVMTHINLKYSKSCDSTMVCCGPFSLTFGYDSEGRKAFIAALQEADAEMDAAVQARIRKEETTV